MRRVSGQTPGTPGSASLRARLPFQKVGTSVAYIMVLLGVDLAVALGENPVGFGQQGTHALGIYLCKLNK